MLTVSVQNHIWCTVKIAVQRKLCKKLRCFPEKFYTSGTNFTRQPVVTAATNLNSLGWGYRLSQSRPIPRSPDGDKNYANMHASAQYTGLRRLPDLFQQSEKKANPELITGCS